MQKSNKEKNHVRSSKIDINTMNINMDLKCLLVSWIGNGCTEKM